MTACPGFLYELFASNFSPDHPSRHDLHIHDQNSRQGSSTSLAPTDIPSRNRSTGTTHTHHEKYHEKHHAKNDQNHGNHVCEDLIRRRFSSEKNDILLGPIIDLITLNYIITH